MCASLKARCGRRSSGSSAAAHPATYDTRSATASTALVDWHDRALWPTFDSRKLRAGLAGCRDRSEHREPHTGPNPFSVTDDYLRHVDAHT
jgi:hypothetical protein